MIVIQARLDSKRWPKKVLANINGKTMISRVYEQCVASMVRPVVVAIPAGDTELIDFCEQNKYCVYTYSGDRNDLIGRYRSVAEEYCAELILRVTGDCPFQMSQEIAWVWQNGLLDDFTSNGWPAGRTTPDGVDCEVYSRRLLSWMDDNVKDARHREHLPLYLYERTAALPSKFSMNRLDWPVNLSHIKTSIDSPEDLEKMRKDGLI